MMNIYVTGPVGVSGALKLYETNKDVMSAHFPTFFQKRIEKLADVSGTNWGISIAKNTDCIYICTILDGGLFASLWDGCAEFNCGCEVFLSSIPVKQEAVEITELTGDNPYEIESEGVYLLFSEKGQAELAEFLNVELHQIGRTTKKKDRVVINGENRRFLTPPKRQKTDIANRKNGK